MTRRPDPFQRRAGLRRTILAGIAIGAAIGLAFVIGLALGGL